MALDQLTELEQAVVERGALERRRQVIDHHGHRAPLRLDALADAVDDVGVDVREVVEQGERVVVVAEPGAVSRQELERGVAS